MRLIVDWKRMIDWEENDCKGREENRRSEDWKEDRREEEGRKWREGRVDGSDVYHLRE